MNKVLINNLLKKHNNLKNINFNRPTNILQNIDNSIDNKIINLDLSDKNVAIVGYASYMKNKNLGLYIDSFDEVVKINIGIYPINNKDLGNKVSIASFSMSKNKIYSVLNIFNELNTNNKKYNNIHDIFIDYNIKYILGMGVKNYEIDYWKKNLKINNENNIMYIIDFDYKTYINNYLFGLTSGLKTIIYILKCKPKKIYICGFDFSMNIYNDFKEFHANMKNKDILNLSYEEWSNNNNNNNNWHSTYIERYILKKLFLKYNFEIDEDLHIILLSIDEDDCDNNIFKCSFYNIDKEIMYLDLFNNICNLIDNNS
jgi:hypothetical protein